MGAKKPKKSSEQFKPVKVRPAIKLNPKGVLGGLAARNKKRDAQLIKIMGK
jgi:hypothetical protein